MQVQFVVVLLLMVGFGVLIDNAHGQWSEVCLQYVAAEYSRAQFINACDDHSTIELSTTSSRVKKSYINLALPDLIPSSPNTCKCHLSLPESFAVAINRPDCAAITCDDGECKEPIDSTIYNDNTYGHSGGNNQFAELTISREEGWYGNRGIGVSYGGCVPDGGNTNCNVTFVTLHYFGERDPGSRLVVNVDCSMTSSTISTLSTTTPSSATSMQINTTEITTAFTSSSKDTTTETTSTTTSEALSSIAVTLTTTSTDTTPSPITYIPTTDTTTARPSPQLTTTVPLSTTTVPLSTTTTLTPASTNKSTTSSSASSTTTTTTSYTTRVSTTTKLLTPMTESTKSTTPHPPSSTEPSASTEYYNQTTTAVTTSAGTRTQATTSVTTAATTVTDTGPPVTAARKVNSKDTDILGIGIGVGLGFAVMLGAGILVGLYCRRCARKRKGPGHLVTFSDPNNLANPTYNDSPDIIPVNDFHSTSKQSPEVPVYIDLDTIDKDHHMIPIKLPQPISDVPPPLPANRIPSAPSESLLRSDVVPQSKYETLAMAQTSSGDINASSRESNPESQGQVKGDIEIVDKDAYTSLQVNRSEEMNEPSGQGGHNGFEDVNISQSRKSIPDVSLREDSSNLPREEGSGDVDDDYDDSSMPYYHVLESNGAGTIEQNDELPG